MIDTPETLIIIIKRFKQIGMNYIKNNSLIKFDETLDISRYKLGDTDLFKYRLFGIGNHIGGIDGGHCYAYCKDIRDIHSNWIKYDDDNFNNTLQFSQVLSPSAYLLFYKKI